MTPSPKPNASLPHDIAAVASAPPTSPPLAATLPDGPSFPPPTARDVPPPLEPGRKRWPVAAALAALAVIVAVATGIAIRVTADPVSSELVAMPTKIEHKFDLDPESDSDIISGEFGRLNTIVDRAVVQYDENGNVRWSQDLPRDWIAMLIPVSAGTVPVWLRNVETGSGKLIFLDADTGAVNDAEVELSNGKQLLYQFGHLYVGSRETIVLYDLDTGRPQATLEDVDRSITFDEWSREWIALNDETVSMYDLDLQPILSNIPTGVLRGRRADGKVITDRDNRVVGYDEDGEVFSTPVQLDDLNVVLPLTGDRAVLLSDETVQLVSGIGGDSVEVLWSADNDSVRLNRAGEDRFVASFEGDDDISRSVLIDSDGNELYEYAQGVARLLDNGLLFGDDDNAAEELVFVDLDGTVLWTIPDATLATVAVTGNVIVDTETNRVYGPA